MHQTTVPASKRSSWTVLLVLLATLVFAGSAEAAAPELSGRPAVVGVGEVGVDLRATAPPNVGGEGDLSWSWERSGSGPIPGATSYHYTLQPEDAGRTVSAVATVTNADGSDSERSLTIFVQEVRPGGGKVASFRQGPRFNLSERNGPEISDITEDGRTLVSTELDVVDLTDLRDGKFQAPLPQTGSGGIVSVSLHKDDRWVLLAQQTFGETTDTVWVIELASREVVRGIPVPEGIDSVNVSPDGNYALAVLEAEGDEATGQIAVIDTRAADPEAWEVTPIPIDDGVPGDAGILTDDPQPEFAAIRDDNTAAVTIQEDNAVAIVDLPTATVTDLWPMGSIDRLADLTSDGDIVFADPYNPASVPDRDPRQGLGAEREPDAIAWIDGGTKLAIAEEGEYDLNGGRGWSVWEPDGVLVWEAESSLDELMARHNLATDGRATRRGNEYEGLTAATFDGREYVFVGSERAFGLAAYDVTNPAHPRFVTAIPTGREPEGIVANEAREIVITSNENGNADAWTVMEGIPAEEIDPDRRPIVGGPGAYRLSLGKLGVAGGSRFVATLDNFRIGILETAAKDRVRLTRITPTEGGVPLGGGEFTDVAVDPNGGWWVLQDGSQLRHVDPDGSLGLNLTPGADSHVGLTAARDGSAVYLVSSSRQVRVYDVAAGTLSPLIPLPQPTGLPAGVSNLSVVDVDRSGDGRLLLFGNSPGVIALVEPPAVGEPEPQPVVIRSGLPRANRGVAGLRNGVGVLPNGDVWAAVAEIEGSSQRSTHLQRYPGLVENAPASPPPPPATRLAGLSPQPLPASPSDLVTGLVPVGDELLVAGQIWTWGAASLGAALVEFGPDGLQTSGLPGNLNQPITAAAADAQGRIYVAGEFAALNTPGGSVPRQRLARILPDGSVDASFAPTINGPVYDVEVVGGVVVAAGFFNQVNGTTQRRIVALDPSDGSIASVSLPEIGPTAQTQAATALELTPDGDLIVAGEFETAGGAPSGQIVRLETSNPAAFTLDPAFSAETSAETGGKSPIGDVLSVGGSLWVIRGAQHIQRLNLATGAIDPALELPTIPNTGQVGGALASDGTRIYAMWRRGSEAGTQRPVIAFDATSGQIVDGFNPDPAAFAGSFERFDLTLAGGALLASVSNGIVALDPLTGAPVPNRAIGARGDALKLLTMPDGGVFVGGRMRALGEPTSHMIKIDPETGERNRSFQPELPPIASNGLNSRVAMMSVDGRRAAVLMDNGSGAQELGVLDLVSGSGISDVEEAIGPAPGILAIQLVGDYVYAALRERLAVIDLRTMRESPARRIGGVRIRHFARIPGTDDILVAGEFDQIDGVERPGLARIDTASGDVVESFDPAAGGGALAIALDGEHAYVGGRFDSFGETETAAVARVDLATGEADPGFTAGIVKANGSAPTAYELFVLADRVVVNGEFDRVDGLSRSSPVALDASTGELVPSWSLPISGFSIEEMAEFGPHVFAGGRFENWGGAANLARLVQAAPDNVSAPIVVAPAAGPRDGAELICDPGTWDGDPDLSYRWLLGGEPIAGATNPRFSAAKDQIGAAIACEVSASNELGSAGPIASAEVTVVPGPPRSTAAPTISGAPVVGATLTAGAGEWDRPTDSVAYEWLRDGAPTGVSSPTFVVPADAGGAEIAVRIVATDAAGPSAAALSPPLQIAVAPENVVLPAITGSGELGVELRALNGEWTGSPSFSHQWLRDDTPIAGATSAAYTPVDADEGTTLTVRVTASTAAGSSHATSGGVEVPLPAAPSVVSPPAVSGSGLVGADVTCQPGTYAGKGPLTVEMRWLRAGTPIAGATGRTYRLAAEDIGRPISCEERVTNKGGTVIGSSTGVEPVQPVPDAPPVVLAPPPVMLAPTPIPAPQPTGTSAALEPPTIGKRGRAARIRVAADTALTEVRLRLSRKGRTYASRKFASLQPDAVVNLRIGKKLRRGTYLLTLIGRDQQGSIVKASEELAIR